MDRREFLVQAGRYGAGACLFCGGGSALGQSSRYVPYREVDFYEQIADRKTRCGVCPRHCVRSHGQTGVCRTRTNVDGTWYSVAHGRPAVLRIDPIEKLTLNHFHPGSRTMSIGSGSCNLDCLYCQNWEHAQRSPGELKTFDLTPKQAVEEARKQGVDTIAFNYTGLIAGLEYAKDVALAARQAEMRVVAATGGFVEPEPLRDFAQYCDAFAVTLKGFTEDFYQKVISGRLETVLASIKTLKQQTDCWFEILNLIVPTYNDDLGIIKKMCGWIRREVGVMTPVHFARFVPMYKLTNLPRTPVQTLERACAVGREAGLRYVYTSNIAPHEGTNTFCHKCGTVLIERLGFKILENHVRNGRCPNCKTRLPGVWA